MKALILSGGTGTRLRPLTYTNAKQLIPIANKPILFYGIEEVVSAGIQDIGIIVGDTKREVMEAVGDGSRWGVKVTYIEQDRPAGLAHAVWVAREFLQENPFMMYLGDNIVKADMGRLLQRFKAEDCSALILLSPVEEPQQFGVAVIEKERVAMLIEKPAAPLSNLALVGVYLFRPEIFSAISKIKPSWRNELEITDAIQRLIDDGYKVSHEIVTGWWKDTGKPEDVLEANSFILETLIGKIEGEVGDDSILSGRIAIAPGAKVVNSVVRGPAVIGENAVVSGAYVGPFTSIGDNVMIVNSEIEYSVILPGVRIENVRKRIGGSLIGKNAVVKEKKIKPRILQMVIGDNSRITLS
jgi:glucose-1-phosphate thymidylyltransferase